MAYCTIQGLEDRLSAGILNGYIPETGEERERILTGYANRASARIDAILCSRYAVPVTFTAAAPLLEDLALSLSLWQIAADRGRASKELPAGVQIPYDEAMKTLRTLADGTAAMPGTQKAEGSAAGMVVESPPSIFAHGAPGMENF